MTASAEPPPPTEAQQMITAPTVGALLQAAEPLAEVVSRFLAQATFGPTLDDIESLSAATVEETEMNIENWLIEQMNIEPSLHRAYLRRRVNVAGRQSR